MLKQQGDQVLLEGKLDVDSVNKVFRSGLDYSTGSLAIDLSGVSEVDSAGIALLVHWHQQGNRHNCVVRFLNPGSQVATMMQISGVGELLTD